LLQDSSAYVRVLVAPASRLCSATNNVFGEIHTISAFVVTLFARYFGIVNKAADLSETQSGFVVEVSFGDLPRQGVQQNLDLGLRSYCRPFCDIAA
jgi:hypothetical protein